MTFPPDDPTTLLADLGTITAEQLRHTVSVSDFLWDTYSQSDRNRAPSRTWPESDKHMARRPMKLPEVAPPEGRRGIHSNVPATAAERMVAADVTMCEPPNTGSGAFDNHMRLRAATLLHDLVTQSRLVHSLDIKRIYSYSRVSPIGGEWGA